MTRVRAVDGRAIGIGHDDWPYLGNTPDVQEKNERFLVKWASHRGLKRTRIDSVVCLRWVRGQRCSDCVCPDDGSPLYADWYDHVTAWSFEGRPALLLSQPYGVDVAGLKALLQINEDPELLAWVTNDALFPERGTIAVEVWNRHAYDAMRAWQRPPT